MLEKGNVILGLGSGDDSNGDRSMGGVEKETIRRTIIYKFQWKSKSKIQPENGKTPKPHDYSYFLEYLIDSFSSFQIHFAVDRGKFIVLKFQFYCSISIIKYYFILFAIAF